MSSEIVLINIPKVYLLMEQHQLWMRLRLQLSLRPPRLTEQGRKREKEKVSVMFERVLDVEVATTAFQVH